MAIDSWAVRNLISDVPSKNRRAYLDLDDPDAKLTKFLRYYRQVYGAGTIDPALIEVASGRRGTPAPQSGEPLL